MTIEPDLRPSPSGFSSLIAADHPPQNNFLLSFIYYGSNNPISVKINCCFLLELNLLGYIYIFLIFGLRGFDYSLLQICLICNIVYLELRQISTREYDANNINIKMC